MYKKQAGNDMEKDLDLPDIIVPDTTACRSKSSSYFANTNISKYLPNGCQIFYMNTKLDISFPLAFPLRKHTEQILIRGQLGTSRGEGRFTDIKSTQF